MVTLAARILLGAVFVYAGATKALDPAAFAAAIDAYRLLPYPLAVLVALYLPWLEIVCGLGLFWRRMRLGSLWVIFALCLVFTGALASAWIRNLDISCGCFGAGATGAAALRRSLLRSLTLAFVSSGLLWRERLARRSSSQSTRSIH